MRSRRGSTLVELLIAITLVSLLSVGMLFAIRVGINTLEATKRRVMVNRRTTGAQRILELQIAGFIPVAAQCGGLDAPPGPAAKIPFFQGEPGLMRFVTSYSLQEAGRGYPRILELLVGPGEAAEGVRLLANEYLYTGPAGAGAFCAPGGPGDPVRWRPAESNPGSFVLADKLVGARFVYLVAEERGEPQHWVPRWTNKDRWPAAIRIEMAPLQATPDRIPPLTITAPIRTTRKPEELMK